MKSITWKTLFFSATILLIGATSQIVQAESFLYWTETTNNRISRSTLQGTLEENVVPRRHNHTVGFMAADSTSDKIYWTETFTLNNAVRGTIFSAHLDGSNPVPLMDSSNGVIKKPFDIELDIEGGKMYWSEMSGVNPGIYRANLDGTYPIQLVDLIFLRNNYGVGLGQNFEYAQAFGLALDLQRGQMCWTDSFAKDIHCSDLNGAEITQVVPPTRGARGIAIDPGDGKIYWVTGNAGDVMRVNADGTNLEQIVNGNFGTDLDFPMDIATDSLHLYFTDVQAGTLYRSNMDGSGVIVLHTLQYENAKKPGTFKNLSPTGIALSLEPTLVASQPVVKSPVVTQPVATRPIVTQIVATQTVVTQQARPPLTLSVPKTPAVIYKPRKGAWYVIVDRSTIGVPTTYDVILFDPANPGKTLTLLSGQSTNSIAGIKVKGMSLASQGFSESGSYVAITVTAAGLRSAPVSVKMKIREKK